MSKVTIIDFTDGDKPVHAYLEGAVTPEVHAQTGLVTFRNDDDTFIVPLVRLISVLVTEAEDNVVPLKAVTN